MKGSASIFFLFFPHTLRLPFFSRMVSNLFGFNTLSYFHTPHGWPLLHGLPVWKFDSQLPQYFCNYFHPELVIDHPNSKVPFIQPGRVTSHILQFPPGESLCCSTLFYSLLGFLSVLPPDGTCILSANEGLSKYCTTNMIRSNILLDYYLCFEWFKKGSI